MIRGFTLIESLVAITLLTVSIVGPMALAEQSLTSAYYARDQITASYLAQDGIEAIRELRDSNILKIAEGQSGVTVMQGIDTSGSPFTVDDSQAIPAAVNACPGTCPVLRTDGEFYGYNGTWQPTSFVRTITATYTATDEVHLTVTISWQTGSYQTRTFTVSEDMYRWVNDGSAQG